MTSNDVQAKITEFVVKLENLAVKNQKLESGDMYAYLLTLLSELLEDDGSMFLKFQNYREKTLRPLGELLAPKHPYFTDFFDLPFFVFNHLFSGPLGLDDGFPFGKPDILSSWFKTEDLVTRKPVFGDILVFEVIQEKKKFFPKKSKNRFFTLLADVDTGQIIYPINDGQRHLIGKQYTSKISEFSLGKRDFAISSERLITRQLQQFKSEYAI